MTDPLLGAPYGQASSTDFQNNWRKADVDFLQKRSILRYAATAARDAILSPEAGMTIENGCRPTVSRSAQDGWGGSWAALYTYRWTDHRAGEFRHRAAGTLL